MKHSTRWIHRIFCNFNYETIHFIWCTNIGYNNCFWTRLACAKRVCTCSYNNICVDAIKWCSGVYCKYCSMWLGFQFVENKCVCDAPAHSFSFMNFLKHKMKENETVRVWKKSKKLCKNQLLHGHRYTFTIYITILCIRCVYSGWMESNE